LRAMELNVEDVWWFQVFNTSMEMVWEMPVKADILDLYRIP